MVKKFLRAVAIPTVILLSSVVQASAEDTVRVRGTVERIEGPVFVVKTRDGSDVTQQSSIPDRYPALDDSTIIVTGTLLAIPPGANLLFTPVPLSTCRFTARPTSLRKAEPLPAVVDLLLAGRRRNI